LKFNDISLRSMCFIRVSRHTKLRCEAVGCDHNLA